MKQTIEARRRRSLVAGILTAGMGLGCADPDPLPERSPYLAAPPPAMQAAVDFRERKRREPPASSRWWRPALEHSPPCPDTDPWNGMSPFASGIVGTSGRSRR